MAETIQIASFEDFEAITTLEVTKLVAIPELGAGRGVMVRRMSRDQFLDLRQSAMIDGQLDQRLWEIQNLVQGVAQPPFNVEQAERLLAKPNSSHIVGRIVGAVSEFNKATEEARKEAEESFPEGAGQGDRGESGADDGDHQD